MDNDASAGVEAQASFSFEKVGADLDRPTRSGTACSTDASPQCSGVLVADESDFPAAEFTHALWGGTDEAGVDARYGAFPSEDVWFHAAWDASARVERVWCLGARRDRAG